MNDELRMMEIQLRKKLWNSICSSSILTRNCLLVIVFCLPAVVAHAQWTVKDSLNLQRMLGGKEEIKLNLDAVKKIDFSKPMGAPSASKDKPGLRVDETLPNVLNKKKIVLTLHPYNAHTKYNWDPIYQQKIKIDADTWRMDLTTIIPTNWAKNPMDKGIRSSLEEIRASGVQQHLLGERANGMMVTSYSMAPSNTIKLGKKGATLNGGTIGGLDLMTIFTKEFWDKSGRNRRSRTLQVLKSYGDSTTIFIPHPVLEPINR